ncbi:MAG TPA: outer membrane beta-barrel protein [Thermoanaerobaculia bacterium]|nr:outer membrane beta-barrel protein [Thermoanaerobaculia bacterium]
MKGIPILHAVLLLPLCFAAAAAARAEEPARPAGKAPLAAKAPPASGQDQSAELQAQLAEQRAQLAEQRAQLAEQRAQLAEQRKQIEEQEARLRRLEAGAPAPVGDRFASTLPIRLEAPAAGGRERDRDAAHTLNRALAALAVPSGGQALTTAGERDLASRAQALAQGNERQLPVHGEPNPAAPAAAAAPPPAPPAAKAPAPFAFADFTWLNGNSRTSESPIDTKVFTGEFRADVSYITDFNHPQDNTLVGSSETGRTNEFQLQQLGIGGDFHYDNVQGRLMTQFGMYSTMTPRNDASPGRGQWNLDNAYRYLSEAYGGYHIDKWNGINIQAGIFMSYVGLFSYYNFDNWAYQPSYVSSNTPWFFNGLRVQIFPTDKLKIEPWFINGWQSYGKFNSKPGLGMQVLWRPTGSISVLSNSYAVGTDTLGNPTRTRWHSDDSIEVKYYDHPERFFDKSAFSLTLDAGCESGGGVHCTSSSPGVPAQYFLGYMIYNRFWFHKDLFAVTIGGGQINNPGRYLVLLPPINGATAFSGTPYFTEKPGDPFRAYDGSVTFDYMPSQFVTFRAELDRRGANVPYFAGPGGVTPGGGNTGPAGSLVPGFTPDLRKTESRINWALLVKF